jgi:hypothetical protein
MPLQKSYRSASLCVILFFALLTPVQASLCGRIIYKILKSAQKVKPVYKTATARYLLLDTPQGKKILAEMIDRPTEEISLDSSYFYNLFLQKTKSKTNAHKFKKLSKRIKRANDALNDRGQRFYLSNDNKEFLNLYAQHFLILHEKKSKKETKYLKKVAPEVKETLSAEQQITQLVEKEYGYSSPIPIRKKIAALRAVRFVKELRSCLKSMPKKEKRKQTLKLAFQQAGIAIGLTTWGYVAAAEGDEINWANLTTDVVIGGVSAVIEPLLAVGTGTIFQRYLKMVAYGGAKATAEGTLFYINPLTETNGRDRQQVAVERSTYSFTYAAASSVIKLGFFGTILGMQCLYPNYLMDISSIGAQWGFRMGSSYAYFSIRNQVIPGSLEEEDKKAADEEEKEKKNPSSPNKFTYQ